MESTLSVYRSENKYVIDQTKALSIEEKLSKVLEKDAYSKEKGTYVVRSLYFDSINNIDFNTKLAGTEIRKKIRLRVYSPDDKFCKLEAKMKNGDLQHKVSVWIKREDAKELIKGNCSVLFSYFKDSEAAKFIYKTMVLGCYRPRVMIEYDRTAYTYPEYSTRITFDKNVRTSESNFDIFDKNINFTPIFNNNIILEIKYNEKLMKFISKILQPYHLNRLSVSKYCIGRPNYYRVLN